MGTSIRKRKPTSHGCDPLQASSPVVAESQADKLGQIPALGLQWDLSKVPSHWRTSGPRFCPVALVMFVSVGSPWATNTIFCECLLCFPVPCLSNCFPPSSWHWFTRRPACPSFNCMIEHKQKEILCCGERDRQAASDFSCQLIRIFWVQTRSNEIRKKMQCPVCVSYNCIVYVNRMNDRETLKQILNISLKTQRQEARAYVLWRERKKIYFLWTFRVLLNLSCSVPLMLVQLKSDSFMSDFQRHWTQ